MKIVYTHQSLESLEESMLFLLKIQKLPLKKVIEIKNQLLNKADSLSIYPEIGPEFLQGASSASLSKERRVNCLNLMTSNASQQVVDEDLPRV